MRPPRAVADGGGGTIIAVVDLDATPERVFRALTTSEVERWWGHPDFYSRGLAGRPSYLRRMERHRSLQQWNHQPRQWGVAEIDAPNKIVMTRRFEEHPLLGTRETTITYRLEPIATGTRVTVRDEGFLGRSQAAYGNAEHWEKVLGWLDTYLTSESEGAASA